jgi:hypothetical protein
MFQAVLVTVKGLERIIIFHGNRLPLHEHVM